MHPIPTQPPCPACSFCRPCGAAPGSAAGDPGHGTFCCAVAVLRDGISVAKARLRPTAASASELPCPP